MTAQARLFEIMRKEDMDSSDVMAFSTLNAPTDVDKSVEDTTTEIKLAAKPKKTAKKETVKASTDLSKTLIAADVPS